MDIPDLCWNILFGTVCLLVVAFTFVFAVHSAQLISQLWKMRAYRSRMALPFLGNCWNPEVFSIFRHMAQLRKEFGKTFVLYLFTRTYLVTVDPQLTRRVLGDAKLFASVLDEKKTKKLLFGESLFNTILEQHRHSKDILTKYFSIPNISRRIPVLNKVFSESMKQLLEAPMGEDAEKAMRIDEFFAAASLRAFFSFTCGVDYRGDLMKEGEILRSLTVLGRTDSKVNFLPVFAVFLNDKITLEAGTMIRDCLQSLLNQYRNSSMFDASSICPIQEGGLLRYLLNQGMPDESIVDHLYSLLSASTQTTTFFMSFLCLLLAENASAQEKLRHEIFMHAGIDGEITMDVVARMTYLPQVLQETLRLYATVPYVTRRAIKTVHLKDNGVEHVIPEGTNIILPLYLLNRDPAVWSSPSKFLPERFAGKNQFLSVEEGFYPFGYGQRSCVGGILAQMKAAVLICSLLRKYSFRPEPGFKVAVTAGMTLVPSDGVRVIVERLPR